MGVLGGWVFLTSEVPLCPCRFRAKMQHLDKRQGLLPESQNLAANVLYVLYFLDRGPATAYDMSAASCACVLGSGVWVLGCFGMRGVRFGFKVQGLG